MAAPTKTKSTLLAAQTIAAGATATGPWVNCTTFFELLACLAITVPGSAPSAGPTITFSASPDGGTTVYQLQQFTGVTTAQSYIFSPDDPTMYLQLAVKNNDAASNSLSAVADLMHVDSVA